MTISFGFMKLSSASFSRYFNISWLPRFEHTFSEDSNHLLAKFISYNFTIYFSFCRWNVKYEKKMCDAVWIEPFVEISYRWIAAVVCTKNHVAFAE